jgi:hypothetical protein
MTVRPGEYFWVIYVERIIIYDGMNGCQMQFIEVPST